MLSIKFVLVVGLVLRMLPTGLADEFNRTGTDIIVVGNGIIDYAYQIIVMLLFGMAVVAGYHILKDSTRSTTTAESSKGGSTGYKIVKGIIICLIILLCAPYIINMLL